MQYFVLYNVRDLIYFHYNSVYLKLMMVSGLIGPIIKIHSNIFEVLDIIFNKLISEFNLSIN